MKRMEHGNTCPVCGKRKGGRNPLDHSKCSKILKANGSLKEGNKPKKTLSEDSIEFLSTHFD